MLRVHRMKYECRAVSVGGSRAHDREYELWGPRAEPRSRPGAPVLLSRVSLLLLLLPLLPLLLLPLLLLPVAV